MRWGWRGPGVWHIGETVDIERYRGTQGQIFREYDTEGARILWQAFDGHAAKAAEFLGFRAHDAVRKWFRKAGLAAEGHRSHRPFGDTTPPVPVPVDARFIRPDGQPQHVPPHSTDAATKPLDYWRELYWQHCNRQEFAVQCKWAVPRGTETVRLHFIGDVQFGAADLDWPRLRAFLAWLQEPEQATDRWIGLGDWFEQRTRLSKGAPTTIPDDVAMQLCCEEFGPVMAQCLLMHTGNHDQRVQVQTDAAFDPAAVFAAHFKVPFAGFDGFHTLALSDGRRKQSYTGYCHHGWGAARTAGARANQLQLLADITRADYGALGHLHSKEDYAAAYFGPDEDGLIEASWKPVVRCGSWKRHVAGSYARERGYRPGVPGAATLILHLDKHDVHVRS